MDESGMQQYYCKCSFQLIMYILVSRKKVEVRFQIPNIYTAIGRLPYEKQHETLKPRIPHHSVLVSGNKCNISCT